ncbi:hypothetical protein CPB97_002098 [Podila verticillata]|nr:hypothetical protein CPB97_002098 [Podila verticillata]
MQALTPLLFSMLFPRFSTKDSTQETYDAQAGYAHLEQHDSLQNTFEEGYAIQNSPTSPKLKSARRHSSMGPSTSSGHKTSRRSLPARPASSASLVSSSSSTAINSETDLDIDNTATIVVQQRKTKKHLSLDTAAYRATYPSLDGLGDTGSRPSSMEWFGPFVVDSPQQHQTPSRSSSSSSSKSSRLRKSITAEPSMPASRISTSSVCSLASDVSSSSSTTSSVREPLTPTTRSSNYRSVLKDHHPRKGGKKAIVEDLCLSPASTNFFHEDQGQKRDEAVIEGLGISARSERQLAH